MGTWNTYSEVQMKVDREAQTIASLYRDTDVYPEPMRSALRLDLRDPLREVIEHSWPQQRRGIVPTGSGAFLDRFQQDLVMFQPATVGEQVVHAETYKQFNDLVERWRARLDSVTTSLPRSLWTPVLLGALISIGVTLFFDTPSLSMHFWRRRCSPGCWAC